jgi:hypothetical protein
MILRLNPVEPEAKRLRASLAAAPEAGMAAARIHPTGPSRSIELQQRLIKEGLKPLSAVTAT